MSILYNYASELKSSFSDLKDSTSPTNWILYGYEGDDLRLISKGCEGVVELKDEFDEECVQYALLKMFDAASKMSRYIYIAWCGEYSQPFQKANFSQHSQIVEKFLNGFHVKINARCYEDVEPEAIISKVQNSSFTSFTKTNLKPKSPRPSPFASKRQTPSVSPPPTQPKVENKPEETKTSTSLLFASRPNPLSPKPKANPLNPVAASKPNPLSPTPKTNPLNPIAASKPNPLSPKPKTNPLNPLSPKPNPLSPKPKTNPLNPLAPKSNPLSPKTNNTSPVVENTNINESPVATKINPLAPSSRVNPLAPKRPNPLSPSPKPTTTTTISPKPNPLARANPLNPATKPRPNPLNNNNNNNSVYQSKPEVTINKPTTNYTSPVIVKSEVEPEENENIDTSSRDSVKNVRLLFEKKPEKVSKIKIKSPFFHPENNFKSQAKVREERMKREQEDQALRERETMANKERELKETISDSKSNSNESLFEKSKAELTLPKSNPLNTNTVKANPLTPKTNPLNASKANPLTPKTNPLNPPKANPLNASRANPLTPKTNPLNASKANPLTPKANPLTPKTNPLNSKITSTTTTTTTTPPLPSRNNPLAPPSLPSRSNPLAPPSLPPRENPLAPPPLPSRNENEEKERKEREEKERREREEQERREREEKERKEREEQERKEREEQERREREEQEKLSRPKIEKSGSGSKAVVTFDYEPAESNEIALVEGEIISKIVQLDEGWWQGENSKGECGLFPSNYVEMLEEETEDVKEAETEADKPPELPKRNVQQQTSAIAVYDYEANEDNEISFKEGDIITNINFVTEDWWEGVCDNKCGLFPGNYVEINGN